MKKRVGRFISLVLTAVMVLSLAGCGSSDSAESAPAESGTETAASGEKIVNIGVTDSLGSINPFVIDQTFINKYAVDLQFLPLVEFDENLNFVWKDTLPNQFTQVNFIDAGEQGYFFADYDEMTSRVSLLKMDFEKKCLTPVPDINMSGYLGEYNRMLCVMGGGDYGI